MMKKALIALIIISAFTLPAAGSAPELEVSLIGKWGFMPVYTLEGKARNMRGFSERPVEETPLLSPPAIAPVRLLGMMPTERRMGLLDSNSLPEEAFTIELWLLVHVPPQVGALAGAVDPAAGKGWFVSFYDRDISFGLSAGDSDMETISVNDVPPWGRWYHVAATYDGSAMSLYVNGNNLAGSDALSGGVTYPNAAEFEIAAYLKNEPYMGLGNMVHEVRLYNRALSVTDIESRYDEYKTLAMEGRFLVEEMHFTAGPILQNSKKDSMTILWETDRPSSGTVKYRPAKDPEWTEVKSEETSRLHEVALEELKANTPYFYSVVAEGSGGEKLDSGELTFRTAVEEGDAFSFIVIGDTETRPHINDLVAKMAWRERPNFIIVVGDLTDGGFEDSKYEWTHEYLAAMSQLYGRIPVFPAIGNGEADTHWFKYFHSLPGPEVFYTFRYGDAEFFMLNSNLFIGAGTAQYLWLKKKLRESDAEWKFVCHHHPPYSSDENDYGDTYETVSMLGDPRVQSMAPLYERGRVDAVFFGHIHGYERSWPVRRGKAAGRGVVYVQTGGAGGNLENFAPTRNWFTSKLFRNHHYCLINIFRNKMYFKMYDIDGRLLDFFEITKPGKNEKQE